MGNERYKKIFDLVELQEFLSVIERDKKGNPVKVSGAFKESHNRSRLAENENDFEEICNRELKKYNTSEKDEKNFLVYLTEHLKQLIKKHENNIEYAKSHYNCLFMAKEFIKYIETKISPLGQNNVNELQWYGSKTDLIELIKALKENGNLKGIQGDIFIAVQKVFNIELKNYDQAITKFNSRNQENETKFLDTLKSSLSKYIETKLEKKR